MDMVFLGAMSIIGLIVLTVSREVAIFLVDAGLLFEEFFSRVARLFIPAFAFFTFYSLIVILFLFAYRNPLRLGLPAYLGIHTRSAFQCGGRPPWLELFGVDLFLDQHHQHGRLRGYYCL